MELPNRSPALPTSASTLSPAVLAIRPPWLAISPSRISRRAGKRIEGCDLIGSHEAAIALDVGRKDSSQPALHFNWVRQG